MKTKKNAIFAAISLAIVFFSCSSCSYEKLPPKTSDANTSYVTPKGELPSSEEKQYVESVKREYDEHTK